MSNGWDREWWPLLKRVADKGGPTSDGVGPTWSGKGQWRQVALFSKALSPRTPPRRVPYNGWSATRCCPYFPFSLTTDHCPFRKPSVRLATSGKLVMKLKPPPVPAIGRSATYTLSGKLTPSALSEGMNNTTPTSSSTTIRLSPHSFSTPITCRYKHLLINII